MKKAAITVALLIVGSLAVSYLIVPLHRSPWELTAASPNRIYSVYMQEREEEGSEHVVRFNVTKGERPLIADEVFYSDSGQFIYPFLKYSWVAENVLRFGEFDPSVKPDEISVINQTVRVIRYLKVNAGDSYLLLELQPQSTTKIFDRPQTDKGADISWVGGFGQFDDGRRLYDWGMNFHVRGKYTAPAHYCIFIREQDVVVRSREFEGFNTDKSGKLVEVPDAKNMSCQ